MLAALAMSTLVAVRHNPLLKRLLSAAARRGKPAKLALTAAMRKLLTILNAMLKHHIPWSPPCPNPA